MNFALLGDHPDGLAFLRALTLAGRHRLLIYSGSPLVKNQLDRWQLAPRLVGDLEEVLADPAIEAVVIADSPTLRSQQLRRVLQSERLALCVHPAGTSPDIAHEAQNLQQETGKLLFSLQPESLHPGIRRLAELARNLRRDRELKLVEIERWSTESPLLDIDFIGQTPGLPGWDVLRLLGGDVAELTTLAEGEEFSPESPILLVGQFTAGGMFQVQFLPFQADNRYRLSLVTVRHRVELLFPQGWPGPAELKYRDEQDQEKIETWPDHDPWSALVEEFERTLENPGPRGLGLAGEPPRLGWIDEQRGLELDEAARRSLARRRASVLEYQEGAEEATFKGTMTLVGCSLLWVSLVLLIFSVWFPWMGWLILPTFGVFLGMQFLRYAIPEKKPD